MHQHLSWLVLVQRRVDFRRLVGAAAVIAALLAILALTTAAHATPKRQARPAGARPTVVLVHGAFADASSWNRVTARLQAAGYPVVAPPDPLRGPGADGAYLRGIITAIDGPVVLVGHSYGGEVISAAAVGAGNVKALVYIAAFAPAQGESQLAIAARFPGSLLGAMTLDVQPVVQPDGTTGADAYIKAADFREVFAQDVPARTAAVMAVSQRPEALAALQEPLGPPAWMTLPSWYLVAHDDHAIAPAAERFMARRAGAHTVEIRSSHAVPVSHPAAVTALIEAAAQATAGR